MIYLSNALRKLRLGAVLVKAFWVLILAASPGVKAQTVRPYGPYIVETALPWMQEYFDAESLRVGDRDPRETEKLKLFAAAARQVASEAYEFSFMNTVGSIVNCKAKGVVEFRPAGDPLFKLEPGQPPRTAVTGTDVSSKLIFNLGLISDPREFTYASALALLTHEIGHKVKAKMPSLTQQEIDELGSRLGRVYGRAGKTFVDGDKTYLSIAPVPWVTESSLFYPVAGWGRRIRSTFGVLSGENFIDLSEALDQALDDRMPDGHNFFERARKMINFQPLGGGRYLIELRTVRWPKRDDQYLSTDMGTNFFRIGTIEIADDLKSVRVLSYQSEPTPTELIGDAEAEITDVAQSEDGATVTGGLKFFLRNETHFHAISFPAARFTLLGLLDGRPVRIEAMLDVHLTRDAMAMPAEIHKRPTVTEGRFNFSSKDLAGDVLEITGVESRFFTLGRFSYPEEERKRIRLRETVHYDRNCEIRLRGRAKPSAN